MWLIFSAHLGVFIGVQMSTHNCYVHQHISSQLCYRYTRLYWRYSIASRTPRVVYGFLNNPRCLILQIFAKVEICWWGRRSRASVAALESWWSIASERIRLVKGSHPLRLHRVILNTFIDICDPLSYKKNIRRSSLSWKYMLGFRPLAWLLHFP